MAEPAGNFIFPLIGTITSLVVTVFYLYQVKDAKGIFSGSINSYFDITLQYSAISGALVSFFFLVFLLPQVFLVEILEGVVVSDLVFVVLTGIWVISARRVQNKMSSMSENYFSDGDLP